MKTKLLTLTITIFSLLVLTACGGGSSEPETSSTQADGDVVVTEQQVVDQQSADTDTAGQPRRFGFDSQYLTTDYDGATPINTQLLIGTLQLEGTEQAVTAEQAAKLLPFWIALQSGTITNQAESNAVLKQIEGSMSEAQMQAIASLKITNQSLGEWAQANGIEIPQGGGPGGPGGGGGQGGPQDGPLADMTEEERAAFREEMQGLSAEERQERLAELGIEFGGGGRGGEGGGGQGGGGQGGADGNRQGGRGAGGGRLNALMQPLIDLLTERSSG